MGWARGGFDGSYWGLPPLPITQSNVTSIQCCQSQYPISIGTGNIGVGNISTLATFSELSSFTFPSKRGQRATLLLSYPPIVLPVLERPCTRFRPHHILIIKRDFRSPHLTVAIKQYMMFPMKAILDIPGTLCREFKARTATNCEKMRRMGGRLSHARSRSGNCLCQKCFLRRIQESHMGIAP